MHYGLVARTSSVRSISPSVEVGVGLLIGIVNMEKACLITRRERKSL